jgi:hypothetical protein
MTRTYIYDPVRSILVAQEDGKSLGGYFGRIADKIFETLLMTDAVIHLGEIMSKREREAKNSKTT